VASLQLHRGLPSVGPGSLRLALTALSQPLRHTPLQLMAGWLPAGLVSTSSLEQLVGRAVPGRWVDHPNFWAVACDYGTGRRTVFGRLDAPPAAIGPAVAASCAIPGFYRPVGIGRRRYIDGGVCSPSNLDLLAGRGLDLVICLNPLSSDTDLAGPEHGPLGPIGALDPRHWLGAFARSANGHRVAHEAGKVRRFGTEVLLLEPTAADRAAMGRNLMSAGRRQKVISTAERTVAARLRRPDARALLAGLLPGAPHMLRRPPGPPSSWPPLGATAPEREAA
jgi:NTE family protein